MWRKPFSGFISYLFKNGTQVGLISLHWNVGAGTTPFVPRLKKVHDKFHLNVLSAEAYWQGVTCQGHALKKAIFSFYSTFLKVLFSSKFLHTS